MHVYLHILHVHIKLVKTDIFREFCKKIKKGMAKEACFPLLLISKRAI
jgi:hypothetical protein